MADLKRNFLLGRMNKDVDQRLVRNGEYTDAVNIRVGSDESNSEIGAISNVKGNEQLTTLRFLNTNLSSGARCLGALEDGEAETMYWFIHDEFFYQSNTGKCDMIVSFNTKTTILTYHVVSIDDGTATNTTTLNFNPNYLITGVNLIGDMLFFTDNFNPPRKINVKRQYAEPTALNGTDNITREELLVIKKPPANSPSIQSVETGVQNNFLEERFVSFAYRYRYEDGEYSATSQFSAPSFVPKSFSFTPDAFLNEGMINSTNACIITYNSGGRLVKSVELLFKDMNSGVVKVIEKLDKDALGLVNNTDYTFTFSNSKIFTVLEESEILRLYDNVPRLAKAQTTMGNRLVYGNYVEGYDLKDSGGNDTRLEYTTEVVSNEIGLTSLPTTLSSGQYSINGSQTISNAKINLDFTDIELKEGAILYIDFTFLHSTFTGDTPAPVATTGNTEINFTYTLQQDFASAFELANDSDFIEKIGTAANIQTVTNACSGLTLTDIVNCSIPFNLNSLTKLESGVITGGEPITIFSSTSSNIIGLQLNAMRFVDDVNTPTFSAYEYYQVFVANAQYVQTGSPKSLHSNRGYEVGIVYMDEFNRSSTALVSPTNNNHIPCSDSYLQNRIRVTVPNTQAAPSWATRYKFVIKSDKEGYETIYSNQAFDDSETGMLWILLEGENTRKVDIGDRLIVKRDSNGVLNRCAYATVLDKGSKEEDFISPAPTDVNGLTLDVPSGVYIKVNANDFSFAADKFAVTDAFAGDVADSAGLFPAVYLWLNEFDGTNFIDEPIPFGSKVTISIASDRDGGACSFGCEERSLNVNEVDFTVQQNYNNLHSWFLGDNIEDALNNVLTTVTGCGDTPSVIQFENQILSEAAGDLLTDIPTAVGKNFMQFYRFSNGKLVLIITGTRACGSREKLKAKLNCRVTITRRSSLLVFETEPQDSLPDTWYESPVSYEIANGLHYGNVQNQTTTLPAIIDTEFFNCFAFGNGVESYKVRDSIIGKPLELGNRVTSTSSQDFKRAHRFADLTYSGVFNDETNVNKLNEFNLGLLNFKPLEDDFGPVMLLDGRQTDILVLQEDKISYVLTGKNLISDSTGGSVISSIPEVLGTQIARSEEYGISLNPESYAKWGYDKFFTDKKRGAIINLRGSSYGNEQLTVISNLGMSTYFRDKFEAQLTKQQLGGYDPYFDEYITSTSEIDVQQESECIECNSHRTITVPQGGYLPFCYDLGQLVGDITIDYNVISGGDIIVQYTYDGTTLSRFPAQSGNIVLNKGSVSATQLDVVLIGQGSASVVELSVSCPDAAELTVIQVCVTSDADAGKFIHNEYRWADGTYVSPLHSSQVEFASGAGTPLVSQYEAITGLQGGAFIPANGATVTIRSNKIPPIDDFDFDSSADSFKYLRSSTLYSNNPSDIAALIAAATGVAPISGSSPLFSADFIMPSTGNYLYLIYLYNAPTVVELCYEFRDPNNACCGCVTAENLVVQECNQDLSVKNQEVVQRTNATRDLTLGDFVEVAGHPDCVYEVIGTTTVATTDTIVTQITDVTACDDVCSTYTFNNTAAQEATALYVDCNDDLISITMDAGETVTDICMKHIVAKDTAIGLTKTSCTCTSNLKVRQCRLDDVIVEYIIPPTTNVGIGSFVTLTGQLAQCIFQVVEYSTQTPNETVSTISGSTSCDDACNTYILANANSNVVQVQYENCVGVILNVSIPPKSSVYACVKRFTTPLPAFVTMTWQSCGCIA